MRMFSKFLCVAIGVSVMLTAGAVHAEMIGIHFNGSSIALPAATSAGLVPQTNWNNEVGQNSATAQSLNDSSGAVSGATVTWTSKFIWSNANATDTGDRILFKGFIGGQAQDVGGYRPAVVTISNIPYAEYDVYVYLTDDSVKRAKITIDPLASATSTNWIHLNEQSSTANPAVFTRATSTTAAGATSANYALWEGQTSSTLKVTLVGKKTGETGGTSGNVGLAGIQIVQVPEPSTVVLLGMGVLGLLAYAWRKRK